MQRYIVYRIGQGLLVIWLVSLVIFFLGHVTGDPSELLLPIEASEQDRELFRAKWGLDRPLYVQYVVFMASAATGDLGVSYVGARAVGELIAQRLPNSLKLCGFAMLLALLGGIPLGIVAAVKKDTGLDFLARLVAVLGQSMPSFLIGLLFLELFSVRLCLLPTSGMGGWSHYVLPAATLSWLTTAGIMRLLRSSMLDVMDSEYLKMARIKGVAERWVIGKHALRNAVIPVITFAGMQFAIMLTAAVVVETIFAWPGIGRLAYEAIINRDFPVIRGVILTVAVIVVIVNLTVDIIYAYVDPRVRYR